MASTCLEPNGIGTRWDRPSKPTCAGDTDYSTTTYPESAQIPRQAAGTLGRWDCSTPVQSY